ncbi:SPRY domain-containing SOCS box protein 4-like [Oppia nitens]|uniref:SPRY domain-containing SOCS box protein 4-like n=1 Tax=Oppia nitens TaxID=1686743 RepID=UPI0023DC38BD|nr:SPRY domain-containing SOCS box protein 4-like [Oppia nitens]
MDLHSLVRSIRANNNNNNNGGKGGQQSAGTGSGNTHKDSIAEGHAERPPHLDRLLEQESVGHEIQVLNSWSSEHKSPHIIIRDEGLVGKRRPVAKSTDCIRGRIAYSTGLHVWTIKWPTDCRGTHAMVGVATEASPMHMTGYCSLVGSNGESWGWDLVRNKCYHNNEEQTYPQWLTSHEIFDIPDEFKVVLDMDAGTLGFIVDNVYLGVAFNGLKGQKLYPVISTVWGNGEIGIRYESCLDKSPLLLRECCRQVIRSSIGKQGFQRFRSDDVCLPTKLKNYIVQ